MQVRRLSTATLLAAGLVAMVGCGTSAEKTVVVRGKLMKGGAPFTSKEATGGKALPPGDPGIYIRFVRVGGTPGEEFPGAVDPSSGTFEVRGNTGKGIPPSKYKVTVHAGAFGMDAGKAIAVAAPKVGPQAPDAPGIGGGPDMYGKPIHTQEVDVPEAGLPDLVIDIKGK